MPDSELVRYETIGRVARVTTRDQCRRGGGAGFRTVVQAAHANYHLTEVHNKMREQERGGEPSKARRLDAVNRLLQRDGEGKHGSEDR